MRGADEETEARSEDHVACVPVCSRRSWRQESVCFESSRTMSSRERDSKDTELSPGCCAWLCSWAGLCVHAQACTGGLDVCTCPCPCVRASACGSWVRGDAPAQEGSGLCMLPLRGLASWLTGSQVLPESVMTPPLLPLAPRGTQRGKGLVSQNQGQNTHALS